MKIRVIDISLLNNMLKDYNGMKFKGETFEDFILTTSEDNVYVWKYLEDKNLIEVLKE